MILALLTAFLFETILEDKWANAPAWTDAREYDNTTAGWLVASPLNATLTDTQPVTEPANTQVAVLLGGFSDDFYNRIIIDPGFLDVGNLVTDQVRTFTIFNGYFTQKTLNQITINNGTGLSLSGITPPTVFDALETISVNLTVSTDGPSRIDASLFFDWVGTVDDETIQVIGIRIVALPLQAEAPMRETLEWKTDLFISNNATEQRVRIRHAPRQGLKMSYPVPRDEMGRLKNIIHGWLGNKWAVPNWSQAQTVGALSSGIDTIPCDGDNFDLRAGGLVMIWGSPRNNEVIEIDTVASNQIVLSRTTDNAYTNAILVPTMNGRVLGQVARETNGYNGIVDMNYQVLDNIVLTVSAPAQYQTYDIYYDDLYMGQGGSLTDGLVTRIDVVDYQTGVLEFYSPWDNIRIGRPYRFVCDGPEEAWAFREFLHRRAGRLRPFWIPSFESDMRLSMTGPITSTLTVFDDDFRSLGIGRTHIAIKLNNGAWLPREITGTSLGVGDLIDVVIDSPINVDAEDIEYISFLGLKRFDTDRVEINWESGGICTSTVRMLEIKP